MLALIFDIDGTLVDSVDFHAEAWQLALKKFGHDISFERVRNQIGKGGNELLPEFLSPAQIDQYGDDLKEYRSKLFKGDYLMRVKPFAGVQELFLLIKEKGMKSAIGSSAPKDDIEHYLKILKVTNLVDAKTSADDVEKSKPHPDIFELVLSQLKIPAQEAVVIGDSPFDAEAANKASIKSIGLLCGGFSEESLLQAGARVTFADPIDLRKNLDAIPKLLPSYL